MQYRKVFVSLLLLASLCTSLITGSFVYRILRKPNYMSQNRRASTKFHQQSMEILKKKNKPKTTPSSSHNEKEDRCISMNVSAREKFKKQRREGALTTQEHFSESPNEAFSGGDDVDNKTGVIARVQKVQDWDLFRERLKKLKEIGIDIIETDVVWAYIEPQNNKFTWHYYKKYFRVVREVGLKWLPIISVHVPPSWVWERYPEITFQNSTGAESRKYLNYWHPKTEDLIGEVITTFFNVFPAGHPEDMFSVYISGGMWGELQYPWMPSRSFWGYGKYARMDFQETMKEKYENLTNANGAWGTTFQKWSEVTPPEPSTQYEEMWDDLLYWYNKTLVDFQNWILNYSRTRYSYSLSMKISMDPSPFPLNDIMLGHLDFNAIFSTLKRYEVVPTYTYVKDPEMAEKFIQYAGNHSLKCWGEQAGYTESLLSNLYKGYNAFYFCRITNLFHEETVKTTQTYSKLKQLILSFDPSDSTTSKVFITSPINDTLLEKKKVTLRWESNNSSLIQFYEIQLNQEEWKQVGNSTSYVFTSLPDGNHTIKVIAVTLNLHVSATDTVTFTVSTEEGVGEGAGGLSPIVLGSIGVGITVVIVAVAVYFLKVRKS